MGRLLRRGLLGAGSIRTTQTRELACAPRYYVSFVSSKGISSPSEQLSTRAPQTATVAQVLYSPKTTYGTRGLGLGLIIILRSTCALRALRRGPALAIRRVHGDYR